MDDLFLENAAAESAQPGRARRNVREKVRTKSEMSSIFSAVASSADGTRT